MSSDAKDARWQAAVNEAKPPGIDGFMALDYRQRQALLDAARAMLEENPHQVEPLAKQWRSEAG